MVSTASIQVFSQIFMHLQPGDLLQLARTLKDLQNILMNKSSESIWHATRSNMKGGLPDIPNDMSEPEYTH
ncbi:hypothetical protein BT96DRAFT_835048 [Gymnopus androsaceus JB14]|uniref:F-box domain-containing protein n=1 Tax=Gymnopus androsaceus JB14 TaxID=1447944 RepID=A0A6A4GU62_9AGAR|nr:hypothetical protein BT96DRAFT_835048 [Gymnopus androsaceus JB14]